MIPANKSVLIICPDEERYLFAGFLSTFDCTYKETLLKIYSSLKLKYYDGMIIYNVVKCTKDEEIALKYISDCFPHLNTVAILKKTEVKLSHFLGRNGIKEILFTDELEKLALLLNLSFAKITLEKLNISVENYSPLLQKILRFIESNYLCILTITDIANYIGINECTITVSIPKTPTS